MTTNQGEHAQTEALRPIQRFNNIAGLMNPESRGLYVRYEDHAAQVAALTVTPAQPAAPQGVAEVNWWEADGDKYDASISPMQPAQGVAYAELPDVDALAQEIRRVDGAHKLGAGALAEALVPFLRASHGQAPAGASKFADVIAVQRSEAESDPSDAYMVGLYNGMSMMDANYRNITDWEPMGTVPKPTPTAQAAPAGANVRRSDLVPGVMHCAKCKFQLNRVTLCVSDGNAYAGDNKTEPCPNGCGPLWPVTWEQEARNCWKTLEEMHERLQAAPAAGAVAGPQFELDGVIAECEHGLPFDATSLATLKRVRDLIAAAPTPAAQSDSVLEDAAPSKCSITRYCHANMCLETDADHEPDCPQGHAARNQGGA